MRILITGFDSFGGESINPSNLAINKLPNTLKNIEIKKRCKNIFYDSYYDY